MSCEINYCRVPGHPKELIKYVCTFPECKSARFVCSQCMLLETHRHQNQNIYILNKNQFYEKLKTNLNKTKQSNRKKLQGVQIDLLKQNIMMIRNQVKKITRLFQQIEIFSQTELLDKQIEIINISGFNNIDEKQLKMLINIGQSKENQDYFSEIQQQCIKLIQHVNGINDWISKIQNNSVDQFQSQVKNANFQATMLNVSDDSIICATAMSNDYLISGTQGKLMQIWNQTSNTLIVQTRLDEIISICKFSEDQKLLNVAAGTTLYQFDVKNKFSQIHKQKIHDYEICNFICITDTIFITSHSDGCIVKKDLSILQPNKINAHKNRIDGLDFHKYRQLILSGSHDQSIKVWNVEDLNLVMEQSDPNQNLKEIFQIFFLTNNNLIISLDQYNQVIFWQVYYDLKKLELFKTLYDPQNNIFNMSVVLNQSYIVLVSQQIIQLYTIDRKFVRSFNHNIQQLDMFKTIQIESLKAVIIQGKKSLEIQRLQLGQGL